MFGRITLQYYDIRSATIIAKTGCFLHFPYEILLNTHQKYRDYLGYIIKENINIWIVFFKNWDFKKLDYYEIS